jgi:hypothetical protein
MAAQEALQKLAQQQELLDRAAHFGQLVGLMCMVAVALSAGRLWEVHLVSQGSGKWTVRVQGSTLNP